MSTPTSIAIFGSTGLTGSHILSTLLGDASPLTGATITTISRRQPKNQPANFTALIEPDTTKWAAAIPASSSVVISALGTTRASAGGVAEQWKIDHDLNIELARAAKAAGAKTFVFVSSAGTRSALTSSAPYSRMKNGVEDAVKELEFENGIILKPGTILGQREESRLVEGIWQKVVRGLGKITPSLQNALGQETDVIARATVKATQIAAEGKAPNKFWVIEAAEIIKLGQKGE